MKNEYPKYGLAQKNVTQSTFSTSSENGTPNLSFWSPSDRHIIKLGPLVVDINTRTASMNEKDLKLTRTEFEVLHFLAIHCGKVVSRDVMYTELRGKDWDGIDRSIDQRIKRLRKKIGDNARHPQWIKSIRGTGYLLADVR